MSFSARDYTPNSGTVKVSKLLSPGTQYCTLADIRIDIPAYNPDAMFLSLTLVGPELPDFEGMKVDRMNPAAGTYSGQAAYVKHGKYPFSDYQPPTGAKIERDTQIVRWIANFANAIGVYEKMQEENVSGDTIEEYIANCARYLCNGEYFYVTIGGKEDPNEYGMSYRMYLPKSEKVNGKYLLPFYKGEMGLKDSELAEHMIVFDENKHIEKVKSEPDVMDEVASSGPSPFMSGTTTAMTAPYLTGTSTTNTTAFSRSTSESNPFKI